MSGEYILSTLNQGIGVYAHVTLEVKETKTHQELKIDINRDIINNYPQYINSIKVGVDYFFELYQTRRPYGLEVKITFFNARFIDTTSIVVIYVTASAICKALNWEIQNLSFNQKDISFTFPKGIWLDMH